MSNPGCADTRLRGSMQAEHGDLVLRIRAELARVSQGARLRRLSKLTNARGPQISPFAEPFRIPFEAIREALHCNSRFPAVPLAQSEPARGRARQNLQGPQSEPFPAYPSSKVSLRIQRPLGGHATKNPGISKFLLAAGREMETIVAIEPGDVAVGIGTVEDTALAIRQRGLRPSDGIILRPVLTPTLHRVMKNGAHTPWARIVSISDWRSERYWPSGGTEGEISAPWSKRTAVDV